MDQDLKDIIPGEGLGIIKFGMSREEIKNIIDEPNEKEFVTDEDNAEGKSEIWHYDELEISLGFDDMDGWKLVNIALSSPEYEFHHRKLIGLQKEKFLSILDKIGLTEFLLDEMVIDDEKQTLIRSHETGISFFLDNDVVSEILWTPIIDQDDQVIFPN